MKRSKKNKTSVETLSAMKIGGRPKVFAARDAQDLENLKRSAYYVKKNHPRPDGAQYKISHSTVGMYVKIELITP